MTNSKQCKRVLAITLTAFALFLSACNRNSIEQQIKQYSLDEITYDTELFDHYESVNDADEICNLNLEERINSYIESYHSLGGLSVAIFTRDEILLEIVHGYADTEVGFAVGSDTVFEWGSITKLLTTISVLQLYERGELDLHADIFTYIPEDEFSVIVYPTTVYHLINHTSGIHREFGNINEFIAARVARPGEHVLPLDEAVRNYFSLELFSQRYRPGERFEYSDDGIVLAAYIIQRISGMPFHEYVQINIFAPLGMYNTALHPELSDNEFVRAQREKIVAYDQWGVQIPRLPLIIYPAGSAVSTISDMIKFARALMPDVSGGSILFENTETLSKLHPSLEDIINVDIDFTLKNYGVVFSYFNGFFVSLPADGMESLFTRTIGHGGTAPGFSSLLFIDLDIEVGMVASENTNFGVINQAGFLKFFVQEIPQLALAE